MAPGKARHTRDLCHIPKKLNADPAFDKHDDHDLEFYVKLNFLKIVSETGQQEKLSLQRGLKKMISENGEVSYFNEYIVNENRDRPLLFDEYKQLLKTIYQLDLQEFIVYQNQLEQVCFGD
jgi:hypothetical protein